MNGMPAISPRVLAVGTLTGLACLLRPVLLGACKLVPPAVSTRRSESVALLLRHDVVGLTTSEIV